jgi:conjugal transfer mating pair stabilization protein TraG
MSSMSIVTYGGGEILRNVFSAISLLFNGNSGGIVQPICVVVAALGSIIAVSKAYFSKASFTSSYLIPFIVVSGILMIPSTSIVVEDLITQRGYKVDHVPYVLAKTSEMIGYLSNNITRAFEKAMHTPNDTSYNSTGMIFGSETSLEVGNFHITNGDLDKNLRNFCKQCVLYDVALGKYTIDELKKSTDLWRFFQNNTSKVRMMNYFDPEKKDPLTKSNYLSCKEAVTKMTPFFEKEKNYYAKHDVLKNLPLTFQSITGIKKNQEELIGQQLMMNLISDEYNPGSFAKNRAYMQQRSTYQVLGGLASKSLITMRIVLESLVYASFVFILPLTLLPQGIRFFSSWVWLVAWIQLWPPFFAILNFIMQTVAQSKSVSILAGLSESQKGLSFFTSLGLHNLQEDVFALAGYISISIPFISYAIIKGGVNSFIHLSSSMMSPAQGAASTAAAEQTTGNYTFANTQVGGDSFNNATMLQKNLAPSLSGGYSSINAGDFASKYTSGSTIIHKDSSNLAFSAQVDQAMSESVSDQLQLAQNKVDSLTGAFNESVSSASKQALDWAQSYQNSQSMSDSYSNRESTDISKAASSFLNHVNSLSDSAGITTSEAARWAVSAGIGGGITELLGVKGGVDGSLSQDQRRDSTFNSTINDIKGEDFRRDVRTLLDYSSSKSLNTGEDYSSRDSMVSGYSFDSLQSQQESLSHSVSELEQYSNLKSYMDSNSIAGRSNYTQNFVDWALQKQGMTQSELQSLTDLPENRTELLSTFSRYLEDNNLSIQKGSLNPSFETDHINREQKSISSSIDGMSQSFAQKKSSFEGRFSVAQGTFNKSSNEESGLVGAQQSRNQKRFAEHSHKYKGEYNNYIVEKPINMFGDAYDWAKKKTFGGK